MVSRGELGGDISQGMIIIPLLDGHGAGGGVGAIAGEIMECVEDRTR